jgi:hypothetical protein
VDLVYLSELSVDAVPALEQLPLRERQCVMRGMKEELEALGPDELGEWNLGRSLARPVLEALNIDDDRGESCSDVFYPQ